MKKSKDRVCPVWMAYTFDNPLRKLIHNPQKMFKEYVKEGMTVMDIGCGLGCFSIGLAKMVGKNGKVISVDLQKEMLDRLMIRAEKANIADIIKTHQCSADKIGVKDKLDFALAFWMIHETPDANDFLKQIYNLLKPTGKLFLSDPKMHVSEECFDKTIAEAEDIGFQIISRPDIVMSRTVVLLKK
ncbi:MAG: class I SAM-dependent methyltransferase [Candidatus Cloacimonetes bacterium]|nr:class I SAM-dependent methyltransferase [Candidatus Cloacimonadota bacterium]